jgi:hypothetical protein
MLRKAMVLALLACLLLFIAAEGKEGPAGAGAAGASSSPSASSSPVTTSKGSSGGGSRLPDIDAFTQQLEYWKTYYPDKLDYIRKLLYKEPFTTAKYVPPAVWVYYPSNKTNLSRFEDLAIGAMVQTENPIEIRRAIYLTLEIQAPGDAQFKPAQIGTQIIQVNEYNDRNTTLRIFPELKSLSFLHQMGEVKIKINVTDGQYRYNSMMQEDYPQMGYYGQLRLNVYNIPPQINSSTMKVNPDPAKWDDFIQYSASLEGIGQNQSITSLDSGQKGVEVTLHVFDEDKEMNSITKPFLLGDSVVFSTRDKGLFNESDSGKNFTYRYSATDGVLGGLNTSWTEMVQGPHLRPLAKIRVDDLLIKPEDDNYYWWQKYLFGLGIKSQSQNSEVVTVSLYTDTPSHPKKFISSQSVRISGENFTEVTFAGTRPFNVADRDQPFHYYFTYSSPDQSGKLESSLMEGPKKINPKLMQYEMVSASGMANLFLILIGALLTGILLERRFYR